VCRLQGAITKIATCIENIKQACDQEQDESQSGETYERRRQDRAATALHCGSFKLDSGKKADPVEEIHQQDVIKRGYLWKQGGFCPVYKTHCWQLREFVLSREKHRTRFEYFRPPKRLKTALTSFSEATSIFSHFWLDGHEMKTVHAGAEDGPSPVGGEVCWAFVRSQSTT